MEQVPQDPNIWQNLLLLVETLLALVTQLATLGFHWLVWIFVAAVCLWAVNWKKTRHVLAVGGWAPAVLLIILIALVWSRIVPAPGPYGMLPNFWWQLAYVSALAALAMFCGWLQSVFHWTPHDINLEPPAHGHHGHGHH
jgi:magnesium-transporting ATPase (P-type)